MASTSSTSLSSTITTSTAPSTSSNSLDLADPTATAGITTSSTDFFTTPPPTQTTSNPEDQPNFATTSSLYLFTFLATLLVLLAISCAIVIRSLVIRRRFQRRVQEALAEGYVFPPDAGPGATPGFGFDVGGRRRIDIGEKPKLWDAHIAPPPPPEKSNEMAWKYIMPVSVRIQSDKLTGAGKQPPPPPTRRSFLDTASFGLVSVRHNFNFRRPRFLGGGGPSSANANSSADSQRRNVDDPQSPNAEENGTAIMEDAKLQVSVMIAMPSRYRPRVWREGDRLRSEHGAQRQSQSQAQSEHSPRDSRAVGEPDEGSIDEEEELPDVVLGTSEMPWKVAVPVSHPSESESSPGSNQDGR